MSGKFLYRDVYVIGITHWKDDNQLITLITKEEGKFTVSWRIPKSKKIGAEIHLNLFSFAQVVLQQRSEANYRMRSFETLDNLYIRDQNNYSYIILNFLSRLTQLCDEDLSGEYSAFPLWDNIHQSLTSIHHLSTIEILTDFLYLHGLWLSFESCEECQNEFLEKVYIDQYKLKCHNCRLSNSVLVPQDFINWFRLRYSKKTSPQLKITTHINAIEEMLLCKLGPHLMRDKIIRKSIYQISKKYAIYAD